MVGMRILLVEDEHAIAEPLVEGLTREGFDVTHVDNGADALAAPEPDLVLLDLRLPDIDGFDVARELRGRSRVPIIMITARGEEVDIVVGLEIGADDYLVKPFGFRQLLARIRAVARRSDGSVASASAEGLVVGRLEVDVPARLARLDGQELELTPREFDLLALLASRPGVVVERDAIFRELWGGEWYGSPKAIDVHVGALRRKLGDPAWIETSRSVGFRLRDPG
jgi:two-component system, OmpR family, response regulator RegX3